MTLNYESLIATAQSMEQDELVSATFQASLVEEGEGEPGALVTQGENYPVMPGLVGIYEAVVKVNGKKVTVLQSTWTLNGTMINLEKAVQGPRFSSVPTNDGPVERIGGKEGFGAGTIMAAWVGAPGIHQVTITGTYTYNKTIVPFLIEGSITLLPAPVTAGDAKIVGEVGGYPYEVRNTSIRQALGFDVSKAPNVGFQWGLRTGENLIGTSGFVQIIQSREYLRMAGGITQRLGALIKDENILQSEGNGDANSLNMFYPNASGGKPNADVKISDGPFVGMESYVTDKGRSLTFWGYKCKETKRTYLAYQAIKNPAGILAFVVGASYQDWQWSAQASRKEEGDLFTANGGATLSKVTNSIAWMPLEWTGNIRNEKYQKWEPK